MQSVRQIVFLSVAALMLIPPSQILAASSKAAKASASTNASQQSSSIHSTINNLRRNMTVDMTYRRWESDLIRAHMDREIANLLWTDPDGRKAWYQALMMNTPMVQETDDQHDTMGIHSDAQHPSLEYNLVTEVAQAHDLPTSDIHVWKMASYQGPNAYTYSSYSIYRRDMSVPTPIRVAIFNELESEMTFEQLRAVLSHELTHIKLDHVTIGIVVQAVFDAVGRNLIPPGNAQTDWITQFRSETKKTLFAAIGANEDDPAAKKVVDIFLQNAESVSQRLEKDMPGVIRLANGLYRAANGRELLSAKGEFLKASDGPVVITNGGAAPDPGIQFKKDKTRLTRGQERSADQGAIMALYKHYFKVSKQTTYAARDAEARKLTEDSFAGSMAALQLGVANGNWQQLRDQALKRLERSAYMREDMSTYENGDHPATFERIAEAYEFMKTKEFKIATNEFLGAIDLYTHLINEMNSDKAGIDARNSELPVQERKVSRVEELNKAAATIAKAIVAEVTTEAKANVSNGKAKELLQYMDDLVKAGITVPGTAPVMSGQLAEKYPLFSELQVALSTMDTSLAIALNKEIAERAPVPATQKSHSALDAALHVSPNLAACEALFIK